ncbi:MAG: hypothetical protein NXI24_24635 [bacterium]|nr:hypothetical protein [bacterium]
MSKRVAPADFSGQPLQKRGRKHVYLHFLDVPGPEERQGKTSLHITAFPSFEEYQSFAIDPDRSPGRVDRIVSPNLWYAAIDLAEGEPDLTPKQKGARLMPLLRRDSIRVSQKAFAEIAATLRSLSGDLPDYSDVDQAVQDHWLHAIPRAPGSGARISLSFRKILD